MKWRSSCCSSEVKNPTNISEDAGSIPVLTQGVKDLVSLWASVQVTDTAWIWCGHGCGVGQQLQLIRPLAWELPCASPVALKGPKKKKKLCIYNKEEVYTNKQKKLISNRLVSGNMPLKNCLSNLKEQAHFITFLRYHNKRIMDKETGGH